MNQKLKKTIQNQLKSLENKLDNIRNWQIEIDENMWDSQHYQDLLNEVKKLADFLEKEQGLIDNLDDWETYQNNYGNDDDGE